jgi:KEOPS complex subunit Pcc1
MKRKVVICLELPSEKVVSVLLRTLMPETRSPVTSRSKVSIVGENKRLTMQIKAKDTSALRATVNSYLRWIALVKETYKVIVELEKS